MLLIIVLGIIAKLASVSGDCDVGKTIQDFDIEKFTGIWYFLYHNPDHEFDNLDCPIDIYDAPANDYSRMISFSYLERQSRVVASIGVLDNWSNTGYSQKYDGNITKWNGRVYILAVDYDRYVIFKLCAHSSDKLFTFVAFRRADPDAATMKEMKKALSDKDIDFSQLQKWNADHCVV